MICILLIKDNLVQKIVCIFFIFEKNYLLTAKIQMSRTKLSERYIFAISVIGILIKWDCIAYFSSINQRNVFPMEITNVSKLMGF